MTLYQIRNPRIDAEGVLSGDFSARQYLTIESKLLKAFRLFIRGRRVRLLGYEGIRIPSSRLRLKSLEDYINIDLDENISTSLFKCILRNYFWAFVCVDSRIGFHVDEYLRVVVSGLNIAELRELESFGVSMEIRDDLVADKVYYCDNYR